jgi:pimeloyl-ACP methyl ester carboxylesterase
MPQATLFAHAGATLASEALTEAHGPIRLVWLHGWGQHRERLRPLANSLADLGESWLLDLPGHGAAPLPPSAYSPEDYAVLVSAWLATLPPLPTVLLGHSFGFRVAVRVAAAQPTQVQALVAMGGAGLPRHRTLRQNLRKIGIQLMMNLGKKLQPVLGPGLVTLLRERFGSRDYKAAGALRPTFVRVVQDTLTHVCSHVKQPALLLYGALDAETPPDVGASFARVLPNATLHVLPGVGHDDYVGAARHVVAQRIRQALSNFPLLQSNESKA